MATNDDGGTAFPSHVKDDSQGVSVVSWQKGMSLRDWFAGQAMAGLLADTDYTASMTDADAVEDPKGHWTRSAGGHYSFTSLPQQGVKRYRQTTTYQQRVARDMYVYADAMIAARKEPRP